MNRRPVPMAPSPLRAPLPPLLMALAATLASGCATTPAAPLSEPLMPAVRQALEVAATPPAGASAPAAAARPSPRDELAIAAPLAKTERRFSLVLNNATPEVLFMALLNETPLSVAVDPAINSYLSVTAETALAEAAAAEAEIASGRHRHLLGRVSLIAMAAAFGVAAIAPSSTIACAFCFASASACS